LFRRNHALKDYVDPLVEDDKLRRQARAAVTAGVAAGQRMQRQLGLHGVVLRLATDQELRQQLAEVGKQLDAARKRVERKRSHRLRNTLLVLVGAGAAGAVAWQMRRRDEWAAVSSPAPTTVDAEIEVGVPVTAAYNQWTQFEEFPKFMEGVDEVKQLDDTLLHWAATVSGKHAEWNAKIVEQEPDRRISWESTDGKKTRGTVEFEPVGSDRSRIRLHMSYTADGAAEKLGSAIGLDSRRVNGDLKRFRELIEGRGNATGAWRGEVKDGAKTG
jgi:uncharacterized membrane protein